MSLCAQSGRPYRWRADNAFTPGVELSEYWRGTMSRRTTHVALPRYAGRDRLLSTHLRERSGRVDARLSPVRYADAVDRGCGSDDRERGIRIGGRRHRPRPA